MQRVITIFGSSRVRPGEAEYLAAKRMGRLLAERGWAICNGGHEGTMEAAAWGAKEAGGRTIGVSIGMYRPAQPNVWLDEEIVTESLFERLERLVTTGDAFVVLRGGIGTLLELALVWNLVQTRAFADKPVVVIGSEWNDVVAAMRGALPMHEREVSSLHIVRTVDEAAEWLVHRLGPSSAMEPPGAG